MDTTKIKSTYCGQSPWCEPDVCKCDAWDDAEADKVFGSGKADPDDILDAFESDDDYEPEDGEFIHNDY